MIFCWKLAHIFPRLLTTGGKYLLNCLHTPNSNYNQRNKNYILHLYVCGNFEYPACTNLARSIHPMQFSGKNRASSSRDSATWCRRLYVWRWMRRNSRVSYREGRGLAIRDCFIMLMPLWVEFVSPGTRGLTVSSSAVFVISVGAVSVCCIKR